MKNDTIDKIRNHRIAPRQQAWGRLEGLLDAGEHKKNAYFYRWGAIAASLVSILSFIMLFNDNLDDNVMNMEEFSQSIVFIEDFNDRAASTMDTPFNSIYSIESVNRVNKAYEKIALQ